MTTRLSTTLEIKNSAAVTKFFKGFRQRNEEIEKKDLNYVRDLSAIVYGDIIRHFEKEEGPGGKPWKKWSNSYTAYLRRINRVGNQKLQFSSHLRQTFKVTSFRRMKNGIVWFNNAQTKDDFPYAYAHDEGGPKLPQRKFMYLTKEALGDISKHTLTYLEKPI